MRPQHLGRLRTAAALTLTVFVGTRAATAERPGILWMPGGHAGSVPFLGDRNVVWGVNHGGAALPVSPAANPPVPMARSGLVDWCGTRLEPEHIPLVREFITAGVYDPPEEPLGPLYVVLTFHVVRRSDGTGGLPLPRLVQALDDANLAFANSGIRFCWPGPIDYIDSDAFYDVENCAELDALRKSKAVLNTVNVYFTNSVVVERGCYGCDQSECALCGISSFTFGSVQGIVMKNDCTALPSNPSTFPHELGHYFDLFHTHETALGPEGVRCVPDCCNCSFAGDLLCDTPADPRLGTHNVDTNCRYFGNERDACSTPYTPDPANLMSYSRPQCRNGFTNQQDFRMQATLLRLRPDHVRGDCPGDERWNLAGKVTASDAQAGDALGASVALSGGTALLGANGDDDRGSASGSAYIFRDVDGVWVQVAKLTASDGAAGDLFGDRVALDGSTGLIGALWNYHYAYRSGAAYVFAEVAGVWRQVAKLVPSDGEYWDQFGRSVALSADAALIGADGDDDRGSDSGSAYVFRRVGGVWQRPEEAKLTAGDGVAHDYFGNSVALSGNTALVGAPGDPTWGMRGAAYVFRRKTAAWEQLAKLTASDGQSGDRFGTAAALAGDTAVVGAPGDDSSRGSAYIFREISGTWRQIAKIVAPDPAVNDWFGTSVALLDNTVLVGAHGNLSKRGASYVFREAGPVWPLVAKLTAPDAAPDDQLGYSVSLSADAALLGAMGDDDRGLDAGSAYIFRGLDRLRSAGRGDLNCDRKINLFDIDPFVLALTSPSKYAQQFPNCDRMLADCNGDGKVNMFDIDPFVKLLTP